MPKLLRGRRALVATIAALSIIGTGTAATAHISPNNPFHNTPNHVAATVSNAVCDDDGSLTAEACNGATFIVDSAFDGTTFIVDSASEGLASLITAVVEGVLFALESVFDGVGVGPGDLL